MRSIEYPSLVMEPVDRKSEKLKWIVVGIIAMVLVIVALSSARNTGDSRSAADSDGEESGSVSSNGSAGSNSSF